MSAEFTVHLWARAHNRILNVVRTIPDLDGVAALAEHHLLEAIQYRTLDRNFRT